MVLGWTSLAPVNVVLAIAKTERCMSKSPLSSNMPVQHALKVHSYSASFQIGGGENSYGAHERQVVC